MVNILCIICFYQFQISLAFTTTNKQPPPITQAMNLFLKFKDDQMKMNFEH
jgi:hypothetical protein